MRRIPVLVLALAAIVGLAGCTASGPTPHTSATAAAAKANLAPNGVVGSGTLTSWNGKTTGTLSVVAKSGDFTFELSNFSTDYTGENIFVLADKPFSISACVENNLWQVGLPNMNPDGGVRPSMTFVLPKEDVGFDDPTFFTTFAFIQYPGPALVRGCEQPVVALTTIHWTMASIYPHLSVRDSGPRAGARGTLVSKNGRLFTYTTAQDDDWNSIARRFGVTSAELQYLNPIRHPQTDVVEAYAGQVLNLDPNNRGNSESRRPGAQ